MRVAAIVLALSFASASAGMRYPMGSPASMLANLQAENTGISRTYTFTTSSMEQIRTDVEDYHFQDGYLSMVGKARETRNSDFILKGTEAGIYGWLVLRDRNIAYEYTTDASGSVWVEEVPVSKIFPICGFSESHLEAEEHPVDRRAPIARDTLIPHIGDYNGTDDVNKLQSLPGAAKVLYVDITALQSKPKAQLWTLWQLQAANLSMHQVNVTTDPAVYQRAGVSNSGISRFRNSTGRSSCGLNAWGTSSACNLYLDGPGTGLSMGMVSVHEVGHLLGINHDGISGGEEYFSGLAAFKWLPLMGNGWVGDRWGTEALFQWSKGEYTGASSRQDDLNIIRGKLPYKDDDIPASTPLKVGPSGVVSGASNRGFIGQETDTDVFTFAIGSEGGKVSFKISRIEYHRGSMLDVDAAIHNSSGTQVARHNAPVLRHAQLDQTLAAGSYTLTVQGGAEGTPQNGFTKYSSLGWYEIVGTITGGTTSIARNGALGSSSLTDTKLVDGSLRLNIPPSTKVENIALHATDGSRVFYSEGRVEAIDLSRMRRGVYVLSLDVNGSRVVGNFLKI